MRPPGGPAAAGIRVRLNPISIVTPVPITLLPLQRGTLRRDHRPPLVLHFPAKMAIDANVKDLLKRTSRSMFLSLTVLPEPVRDAMGLGYLFCRAADTIADTRLVPIEKRRKTLEDFRAAFDGGLAVKADLVDGFAEHQADASERELLKRLSECVALWKRFPEQERALLKTVVEGVIDGMRMDLSLFKGDTLETLDALASAEDLDQYCSFIGGEPGRFWTDLCLLRLPELSVVNGDELRKNGIRFGKGLQITNILRDVPKDLRIGRCYIPGPELETVGLTPSDLKDPSAVNKLRPVVNRWLRWGLDHLESGAAYVKTVPGMRLRAAVAWPLLLSLKTLAMVAKSPNLLKPDAGVKVSRRQVYGLMAATPWTLSTNERFEKRYSETKAELEAAIS